MNRYMAAGMLADMRDGKRVIYVGENRDQARDVLAQLAPQLRTYETLRRTHGMEGVASPPTGGSIRLTSVRSGCRGWSGDILVIDCHPTLDQFNDLMPAIASGDREVIRA